MQLVNWFRNRIWESEHRAANIRLVGALLIAVVAAAVFTWVVWHYFHQHKGPNEKVWDWSIAVVGTLLSFLIGLAAGALHRNLQMDETQSRRIEELSDLLVAELEDTRGALRDAENKLKELDVVSIKLRLLDVVKSKQPELISIHPLVLEEVVKSNLFAHGQTKDGELTREMLKLAKAYHKYNEYVAYLRASRNPGSLKDAAKKCTTVALQQTDIVLDKLNSNPNDVAHASS